MARASRKAGGTRNQDWMAFAGGKDTAPMKPRRAVRLLSAAGLWPRAKAVVGTSREPSLPKLTDLAHFARHMRIEAGDADHAALEIGRGRLTLAAGLFCLGFLVVAVRLVDVAVLEGAAPNTRDRTLFQAPALKGRADITDRNGVLLATSVRKAHLYANPRKVLDPVETARDLRGIFPDLDSRRLVKQLISDRKFIWVRRDITPREHQRVLELGLPGLDFLFQRRRVYPHGSLAAHALGFTDIDDKGMAGIERALDAELRAGGRSVALSVDIRVQHILREELARAVELFQAKGAAGIVLSAKTSELLAMVSLPDFDPNDPTKTPAVAQFNRASQGVYELGSTFKLFTAAMVLAQGRVRMHDAFDATRPIEIADFTIRDFYPQKRWLTVPEIIKHSSNIGAARMAMAVGPREQRRFLGSLGLLDATPLELPEVGKPLLPSYWRDVNTMTIGFGHGVAVSPLQLTNGIAALANGGVLRRPTILPRRAGAMPEGRRVIGERLSHEIRKLMRLTVADGTGKKAAVLGYLVGGKTGSAEKNENGRYLKDQQIASFVGAFPMTDPQFIVFIMVDEPHGIPETRGHATGGWVAAPIARAVISRSAALLGVAPVADPVAADRSLRTAPPPAAGGRRVASR